jgi:hypothetical protein
MKPMLSGQSPQTDGSPTTLRASCRLCHVIAEWFILAACALSSTALAFPPSPHHTIYGVVRNEMGEPISTDDATVILETVTGVQLATKVCPSPALGTNYRLRVPMDAGLTPDNYRPTALRPNVSFRMKVLIGGVTYLPIETRANYANLGKPALSTRLDLTLGEDSDGDGLPDAWERALSDMLGGALRLDDIRPGDDSDGDGLTNLQEYLAGTYAFDPQDGFRLDIAGTVDGRPVLEFMAIRGRTYTLFGSADLKTWVPVAFRLSNDAPATAPRTSYHAADVRIVRIEAVLAPDQDMALFKVLVQ